MILKRLTSSDQIFFIAVIINQIKPNFNSIKVHVEDGSGRLDDGMLHKGCQHMAANATCLDAFWIST